MRIAFDRFVALTAALAGSGTAVTACGSDPVTTSASAGAPNEAGSGGHGGKGGKGGKGGTTGGTAGRSTGTGGDGGGRAGAGGSGGRSTGGRAGSDSVGDSGDGGTAGAGGTTAGSAGTMAGTNGDGGTAGSSGSIGQGGEAGDAMGGEAGAGDEAGAGGAPNDSCLGDAGILDCSGLGLPTDECHFGRNQIWRSCTHAEGHLRPGVLEGLGTCLQNFVGDACSEEADNATYACETDTAARACPTAEAADACANGAPYPWGGLASSPLDVCTDGTLTLEGCTELLNAVSTSELWSVVQCADPAGEYGGVSTGTCLERLHHCVFPRSALYPW